VGAFVVAVAEIAGSLDSEASAIAALIGLTAYDVKARLASPLPRVLFQTPSGETARRVLQGLRERGHGALLVDASTIPRTTDLVRVHRFVLDETALFADGPASDRLAHRDLAAIIAAAVRASVLRSTREKELRPQGARPPATIEVEHQAHESVVEHAIYLFPRASGVARPRPWLVLEHQASYLGLGPAMRLTRRENLATLLTRLRDRAAHARFDDRFVSRPLATEQLVSVRGRSSPEAPPPDAGATMHVYLLAEWLLGGNPYR